MKISTLREKAALKTDPLKMSVGIICLLIQLVFFKGMFALVKAVAVYISR